MSDPEKDLATIQSLGRIKQLKLEAAERDLAYEQSRMNKIESALQALEIEQQALADARRSIKADLEKTHLTLEDFCRQEARIMRADREGQKLKIRADDLHARQARQQPRLERERKRLVDLKCRFDLWQEVMGEQQCHLEAYQDGLNEDDF